MSRIKVNSLPGYETIKDFYYVDSEDGKIHGKDDRVLKTFWQRSRKYPYQGLDFRLKNGGSVKKRVDRIIALALVPGRTKERNEVDHINGKHDDDRPENLRWVSRTENMIFQADRKRKQSKRTKAKKKRSVLPGQISFLTQI